MSNLLKNFVDTIGDELGVSRYARTAKYLNGVIPDHEITRSVFNANKAAITTAVKIYKKEMADTEFKYSIAHYVDEDGTFKDRMVEKGITLYAGLKSDLGALKV